MTNPDPETQITKWFEAGKLADPSNYQIYVQKLTTLEPKWHGDFEQMAAFGRACLSEGRWEARIPLLLVEAHLTASRYVPEGLALKPQPGYFRDNEAAWNDVKAVYDEYLKRVPESIFHRSRYATIAAWCGRWDEAATQLKALNGRCSRNWFGSDDAAAAFRLSVAERDMK